MSPRRAAQGEPGGGGRAAMTALLLVIAAVGMLLLFRAQPDPEPFDPRSDEGSGTRGLVVLLERQGATVDVVRSSPSAGDSARVLVLEDRLDDAQRRDLLAFADAGGVVVMADPESTLTGDRGSVTDISSSTPSFASGDVDSEISVPLDQCDVPALAHLRGLFVRDGVRFRGTSGPSCFRNTAGAFAVVFTQGRGLIVQLGDNELFTNGLLRYADNAPLATALLAPASGAKVDILLGAGAAKSVADLGSGDRTLSDLVRPGVWMALLQLAIAFIVFAVARAIRPGRPVREPEQVPIAGSELIVATGNLMQRARHAERAGWLLRGNLYRELCGWLHLPPTTTIEALDTAVSSRTTLPPGTVAAALDREVHDDAGLVRLGVALQDIRDATGLARTQPEPERQIHDEGVNA